MIIALIAAMGRNRVIGVANRLPWKLPADMRWFRQHTLGKPVLMGRKTFESFGGKPLAGRTNIVITSARDCHPVGAVVVHSVDDALRAAGAAPEVMVIGGAQVYAEMLPRAQRLYITYIDADFAGDAWFPEIDPREWHEIERRNCGADAENNYSYSFVVLERR